MATRIEESSAAVTPERRDVPSGVALAAFLAAGIGSSAMGLFVVLNEAGIYAAPTLYGPAGGVSGRTTLAVAVWLLAWLPLHLRWRDREIAPRGPFTITLILIALGVLATFPLSWNLF